MDMQYDFSIHKNMRMECTRIYTKPCTLVITYVVWLRQKQKQEKKNQNKTNIWVLVLIWCFNVQLKSFSFSFIILALVKSLTYIYPASWELIIIIVFIMHGILSIWPKKGSGRARESYHQWRKMIRIFFQTTNTIVGTWSRRSIVRINLNPVWQI